MLWRGHPIWSDPALSDQCYDLMYAFLFRPKAKSPKRENSAREEPFEAVIFDAVCKAVVLWGRDTFASSDDDGSHPISPDLVKTKYTAGIRKLLYGEIDQTGATSSFGTEGLDAFLLYCLKQSDPTESKYRRLYDRFNLWSLIDALESKYEQSTFSEAVRLAIKNRRHESVVGLLSGYFNVSTEESAASAKYVTGQKHRLKRKASDNDRGFFYCYRFSTKTGSILKTFQVFTPSDSEYPYTRYQNFLDRPTHEPRTADGVVFELSDYVCCLGRIGNPGSMIKVMVLQKPDQNGCLGGIVLTSDNRGKNVLSSRILMKPAPKGVVKHSQAGTGLKTLKDLKDELTASDIRRMRNVIGYSTGGTVRTADEDSAIVNLDALIAHHGERCEAGIYLRQDPITGKMEPYDPVDYRQNPFDGVLREFSWEHEGEE